MGPGGSIQAQSLRGRFKPQGCLVGAEQASGRERPCGWGRPGCTATRQPGLGQLRTVSRQHGALRSGPTTPVGHSPSAMAPSTRMPDSLTTHSGWKRRPLSRGRRWGSSSSRKTLARTSSAAAEHFPGTGGEMWGQAQGRPLDRRPAS